MDEITRRALLFEHDSPEEAMAHAIDLYSDMPGCGCECWADECYVTVLLCEGCSEAAWEEWQQCAEGYSNQLLADDDEPDNGKVIH